jgi:2-keto-3-deoxy-L-rhamnonate aldolase RhmA
MTTAQPGHKQGLRQALHSGRPLADCFIKTAAHQSVEILGASGLDFVVFDAEHAPLGLAEIDRMVPAARGAQLPTVVRLPSADPGFLGRCLDVAVDGVMVPHVRSARDAENVIRATRFVHRERGLSPSPRAGGYGTLTASQYITEADRRTSVWCQIEDAEALDELDAISRVEGVDCLFIGPADLARSMGTESLSDPRFLEAVQWIVTNARRHSVPVGIFVGARESIAEMRRIGIDIIVCGSDQNYLLREARAVVAAFAATERINPNRPLTP